MNIVYLKKNPKQVQIHEVFGIFLLLLANCKIKLLVLCVTFYACSSQRKLTKQFDGSMTIKISSHRDNHLC